MSRRKETGRSVVVRSEGKTDVWKKNSAGTTSYGGHTTHYHGSGNVLNHYGRKIGNSKGK